jgi:hypothetical protein
MHIIFRVEKNMHIIFFCRKKNCAHNFRIVMRITYAKMEKLVHITFPVEEIM